MSKAPFRCPVCLGKGIVSSGFYDVSTQYWTTSDTSFITCRTCLGTGIVWGPPETEEALVEDSENDKSESSKPDTEHGNRNSASRAPEKWSDSFIDYLKMRDVAIGVEGILALLEKNGTVQKRENMKAAFSPFVRIHVEDYNGKIWHIYMTLDRFEQFKSDMEKCGIKNINLEVSPVAFDSTEYCVSCGHSLEACRGHIYHMVWK